MTDDPYLDAASGVLRNRLGINDLEHHHRGGEHRDDQSGVAAEPATDPADTDPADSIQPVEPDTPTGDQPDPDTTADGDDADEAGAVDGQTETRHILTGGWHRRRHGR